MVRRPVSKMTKPSPIVNSDNKTMDNRADSDGFFKLLPMPFIYSAQVVREVTGDALNILGFYGATKESLVEKCCRDALVVGITDGGATLHKYFLAKRL